MLRLQKGEPKICITVIHKKMKSPLKLGYLMVKGMYNYDVYLFRYASGHDYLGNLTCQGLEILRVKQVPWFCHLTAMNG
jgi:hypothetical protein